MVFVLAQKVVWFLSLISCLNTIFPLISRDEKRTEKLPSLMLSFDKTHWLLTTTRQARYEYYTKK